MAKGKYEKWLEPQNLILIEGWARDGLTEAQIAHNMGINVKTLWKWKNDYNPIGNALKNGKEVADYEVENALFKSAVGFFVEEQEDKIDMKGNVVPTTKRRYVPPSITAQIFWLKNRRTDKWRDKPTEEADMAVLKKAVELLGGVNSAID